MKKTKALSLLLAASLVFPQFAVMASAEDGDGSTPQYEVVGNASFDSVSDVVYSTDDLTQLPEGTWVATDNTRLTLAGGGALSATRAEDDDLLQLNPSVIYVFPEDLAAGKYILTADVTSSGTLQVASVKGDWSAIKTAAKSGNTYTAEFDLTEDQAGTVAFRFYPSASTDAAAFSISNVKLEFYNTEAIDWEIVEQNNFTTSSGLNLKSYTQWQSGHTYSVWALKTASGDTPTFDAENGRLVFTNSNTGDGIIRKYYNANTPLKAGDYKFVFDLDYDRKEGVEADYNVSTPINAYVTSAADSDYLFVQTKTLEGPVVNTGSVSPIEIPFTLESETNTVYFRAYPNNTTNPPPTYYVDNYKLERKVTGAWEEIYNMNTATAPEVIGGVNYNKLNGKNNHWYVRENNNAIGAVELTYEDGTLSVTARETAISGKPTVMYRFAEPLLAGNHKIDVAITMLAEAGFGDTYTVSVLDTAGKTLATQEQTMAVPTTRATAADVSLTFTTEAETDVVLSIKSTKTDAAFTNAFEIQSVTLSSEVVDDDDDTTESTDDSNEPVDSDSNEPVDSDSNEPVDSDSNEPVDSDSNEPVDSDSNEPVDSDSNTPGDSESDDESSDDSESNTPGGSEPAVLPVELELVVQDATDKDEEPDGIVDIDRTFKVDIIAYATGDEVEISGSGFTVDYDGGKLNLVELTSDYHNQAMVEDYPAAFQFIVGEDDPTITVTSAGVTLATAEFTVKDDVDNIVDENATEITLSKKPVAVLIKLENEADEFIPAVTPAEVELHNIVITVDIDSNITAPEGIPETLYAYYNDGVMYTADGDEFIMPALENFTAAEGYRVGDAWMIGEDAVDFEDITFTESVTLTLDAVKTAVVKLETEDEEKGILTTDSITVDADNTLDEVIAQIDTNVVVPADHYTFDGWYYNDVKIAEGNTTLASEVEAANGALVAKFNAGDVTVDISYVDYVSGADVAADDADYTATVGAPLSVTPKYTEGYVVESVTYQYGEAGEAIALNKDGDAYVSTDDLIDDVIVTVTYRKVVTVTVYTEANDETAERASVTYYALENKEEDEVLLTGLYTTIACEEAVVDMSAVVPTYYNEAGDIEGVGYRYIANAANTNLFIDEDQNEYANAAALLAVSFYDNATITPIAVKQWKITYVKGAGVDTITPNFEFVTAGTAMSEVAKPEVKTTVEGYIVNWTEFNAAIADEAKEITISASADTIDITYTNEDGFLTFEIVSGITENEGAYTADCNNNAVFTLTAADGYVVESVKYNGNDLAADEETGNYTILAAELTEDIAIVAVAKKADFTLTLPERWTYTVGETTPEFIQIGDTVVITPAADAVVVNITVAVEGGETYTLTAVDGVYTLDPEEIAIIGNVTVTANGLAENVAISFISYEEYRAIKTTTQIVKVTGVAETSTVTMGGEDLYWSARYGAHIMIVDVNETAATLANGMVIDAENAAEAINYNGDVNGNETVNTADAAIVSELLLNPDADVYEDILRLRADVYPDVYVDGTYVTVDDCMWILRQEYPAQPSN